MAEEGELFELAKFSGGDFITFAERAAHVVAKERDIEPGSFAIGTDFDFAIDADDEPCLFFDFPHESFVWMFFAFNISAGETPALTVPIGMFDDEDLVFIIENDSRESN